MMITPGKAKALVVMNSIILASGIIIVLFGIGVSVSLTNDAAFIASAGIGYFIALALPLIIPGSFGIAAGVKQTVKGLHIAYLVLVIISLVWVFAMTIYLFVIAAGLTAYLTVSDSEQGSIFYTIYALYLVSAILCLLSWCLELAGSIISCLIICKNDPQMAAPGQTVVVTTGYPAQQAPPYDAKI